MRGQLLKIKRILPELGKVSFSKDRIVDELKKLGVDVIDSDKVETAYIYIGRSGRRVAIYNPDAPKTVQHISLAHEFSHLVLGHHLDPDGDHAKQEAEATNLAFSLVVPRSTYVIDRVLSSWTFQPMAFRTFRSYGATHEEAERASIMAYAWALREHLRLASDCPFGRLCRFGILCPFAVSFYF